MQDWQTAGFGVYIHWPFCLHKCPYCDFNSHVSAKVDQGQWATALVQEMEEKYQQKDYRAMGLIAHKIKPSIDNMGIASLKECIRQIEKIGREHRDDETIPHLLQKIKTTISLVTDALQKEFFQ